MIGPWYPVTLEVLESRVLDFCGLKSNKGFSQLLGYLHHL